MGEKLDSYIHIVGININICIYESIYTSIDRWIDSSIVGWIDRWEERYTRPKLNGSAQWGQVHRLTRHWARGKQISGRKITIDGLNSTNSNRLNSSLATLRSTKPYRDRKRERERGKRIEPFERTGHIERTFIQTAANVDSFLGANAVFAPRHLSFWRYSTDSRGIFSWASFKGMWSSLSA